VCGRYAASADPDALVEEFEVDIAPDVALAPDYNMAPTKQAYIVLERGEHERELAVGRWGLVPSWAKDPSIGSRMINARAETVAEKPSYRRPFAKRRCLVPADGFYEWYAPGGKAPKQPFFIHPADGSRLAMAGLYEWWGEGESRMLTFTVITTSASDEVGRIHDRMPMTVQRQSWDSWLDPGLNDPVLVAGLLQPAQAVRLDAYPVSTAVNNVRNNGPSLVEPLAAE
jgi:putative SOS response-associated peptidase YedK